MSPAELAERSEVSKAMLNQIEMGKSSDDCIRLEDRKRLACCLRVLASDARRFVVHRRQMQVLEGRCRCCGRCRREMPASLRCTSCR